MSYRRKVFLPIIDTGGVDPVEYLVLANSEPLESYDPKGLFEREYHEQQVASVHYWNGVGNRFGSYAGHKPYARWEWLAL